MYRRNFVDLCKQKINLRLFKVQLLQGEWKFSQVSDRDSVRLRANIGTESIFIVYTFVLL
jgi:hypothetical protein